jgi:hypothetical protein
VKQFLSRRYTQNVSARVAFRVIRHGNEVKVAHLDSPMMGQQKCECSVVDLKSSWRREQGVWALSSGRFTRRDDLGFDQCLSINTRWEEPCFVGCDFGFTAGA